MTHTAKVLYGGADEALAACLRSHLPSAAAGRPLQWLASATPWPTTLAAGAVEVLVLDWDQPAPVVSAALEASARQQPPCPVVAVGRVDRADVAMAAVAQGAVDYVVQPDCQRLAVAVTRALTAAAAPPAPQALTERMELLQRIEKLGSVGHWVNDLARGQEEWSDQQYRLLGYEPGTVTPGPAAALRVVHPDDRAELQRTIANFQQDGFAHALTYRVVRPDGDVRWLQVSWEMERDMQGAVARSFGITVDITALKRMQAELEESRKSLVRAQRIGKIGSWEIDLQTGVTEASTQQFTIIGLAHATPLGPRALLHLVHHDDRRRLTRAWRHACEAGTGFDLNHRVRLPSGKSRWVQTTAEVVLSPQGVPLRIIGTTADLTERKRLEQELMRAQKMESLGTLTGGVAHDFNNLLQIVLGHSQIIQGSLSPTDPLRPSAAEIETAAMRGAALTRQLMLFSRRQKGEPRDVNLNDLVDGLGKMLLRIVGEDVRVNLLLAPQLPIVRADPGQLEQALMNLAANAREAMPHGGKLTISTGAVTLLPADLPAWPGSRPGPFAWMEVSDTGVGMNSTIMSRLFEPFFTTKGPGSGVGLGLPVVYGIMEEHQGWISVDSHPGQGSTFRLWLPALPHTQESFSQSTQAILKAHPGRGEVVLLVEDEQGLRSLVTQALTMWGFRVFPAATAQEALDLCERRPAPFALLLSDVVLPDINGVVLADRIRQQFPTLPVLLTSGHAGEQSGHDQAAARGYRFLPKPMSLAVLLETVLAMLRPGDTVASTPQK